MSGTDVLLIRIDVQRDTPDLRLSCLAMMQGLREFEPVSRAVRHIKLCFNSESRTQFTEDFQTNLSIPGATVAESILSRPVFAAVERATVDLKSYPKAKGTVSATPRVASNGIRCLLSAWAERGILEFLYPPWWSDPDRAQSAEETLDIGMDDDAHEWDLWKDE